MPHAWESIDAAIRDVVGQPTEEHPFLRSGRSVHYGHTTLERLPMRPRKVVSLAAAAGAAALVATGLAVAASPSSAASAGCRIGYTITNQWPGGFGANVNITNL